MNNSFPNCSDGDVVIWLTADPKDKIVVHAVVLSLHSTWFKASLNERWNKDNGSIPRRETRPTWEYELHFDKNSDFGMLAQRGRTTSGTELVVTPSTTTEGRTACIESHRMIVRAMYHLPPEFSHRDFDRTQSSILAVINMARVYGCERVIQYYTDSFLDHFDTRATVLQLCKTDLSGMLLFAVETKSAWLFKESAARLIGQPRNTFEPTLPKLQGHKKVLDLVTDKRLVLRQMLRNCEHELFTMEHTGSGWEDAQAISFFRNWLADRLTLQNEGAKLLYDYSRVYRMIVDPDFVYLPSMNDAIAEHAKRIGRQGMSDVYNLTKAVRKVGRKAADIVRPILKDIKVSASETDGGWFYLDAVGRASDVALKYLGTIEDDELPWANS